MLHMVVASHGAETCPAVHESTKQIAAAGLERLMAEQAPLEVTVVGCWANMPGHLLYMIIDAPNAHLVNDALMKLGFHRWSKVDVSPVMELSRFQEVLARSS